MAKAKKAAAKKPKAQAQAPAPTIGIGSGGDEDVAAQPPLSAREHLFRIVHSLARIKGFAGVKDAELYAFVEEQFMPPAARARARYHRSANEMLCQALENDERFKDAMEIAKGKVW